MISIKVEESIKNILKKIRTLGLEALKVFIIGVKVVEVLKNSLKNSESFEFIIHSWKYLTNAYILKKCHKKYSRFVSHCQILKN